MKCVYVCLSRTGGLVDDFQCIAVGGIILRCFLPVQPPTAALEAYCMTVDDVEVASRYRIVVSTCNTAGMLYSQGIQLGHFSHVFVDEVMEPELWKTCFGEERRTMTLLCCVLIEI